MLTSVFGRRLAAATGVVVITSCSSGSDGATEPPPAAVVSVTLTVANGSLQPGQTTQASAVLKDASGNTLTGRTVTWQSSAPAVATVAGSGLTAVITALAGGTATISANSEGQSGTAAITVVMPASSVTLTLANSSIAIGGTTQATATPLDAGGQPLTGRTAAFTSSNPGVATVNATTGLVTAVTSGTTSISATVEGQMGAATLAVCLSAFTPPAAGVNTVHVSASSGSDTGTGSCAQPYKTIAKGVTGTSTGAVVRVLPGTYNAALGEVFPIMLPAGVQLIGDEPNKGQGSVPTRVIGGALMTLTGQNCGVWGSTIYAGTNAVIAGFELTNNVGQFAQMTLLIRNNGITIRNNSIVNNPQGGGSAVYVCNGSTNQLITANRIRDNAGLGLGFIGGGVGARVENNVIVFNQYGVEYDSPGGDLGGGSSGSTGGNTISCNTANDLWTNQTGITINAANNFWDHVPLSGNDLFSVTGMATIVTTGAALAPQRCP